MADPIQHLQHDRFDALLATLDAVNAVLDHVTRDDDGSRQRAALLDPVLTDCRAACPVGR